MAAYEQALSIVSLPTTSTGLKQYRFVTLNSGGNVIYTSASGSAIGVLQGGTTGSTVHPVSVPVAIAGISKVANATASSMAAGDLVAATSRGSIKAMAAAAPVVGVVVSGSSGGANRVSYVLLAGLTASTATV